MFTPKSSGVSNMSNVHGSGGHAEKSFTSASARAMAAAAARRRSSGVSFLSSGAKKSPFNVGGRTTPLNRSFQASQITETGPGLYTLESYGSSLPALVMEALTFAEKSSELSAVISISGWAWLVAGRRLLIWKYKSEGSRRVVNQQFRELTLPSSDVSHKAQLVAVYLPSEGQVPSCIAVSPEGTVRYWSNITHESSYVEAATDLLGQECDNLLYLGPTLGCLLSTTTSTVLQIQPVAGTGVGGQVSLHPLKAPAGILGGISRKVTSLVFGSMPSQAPEARLVGVVAIDSPTSSTVSGDRNVIVVSARSLQKWVLQSGHPENLLYEANIDKIISDAITDHVWGRDRVVNQVQMWLISVQPVEGTGSIMILTAAVNSHVSQQLVYSLVTLDTSGSSPPQSISSFSLLKHSEYYQESSEPTILSQKFLLMASTAYIYSKTSILCAPASATSEDEAEDRLRLEFTGPGDSILGLGRSHAHPLVFSANLGIVAVVSSASADQTSVMDNETFMNETMDATLNMTANITAACEVTMTSSQSSGDTIAKLQEAFIQYCKKNVIKSQNILDEVCPSSQALGSSGLDGAVVALSKRIVDEIPVSDPRWAQANQTSSLSTTSTTSLIIANQIKDKILGHQYFISFLQRMSIWPRLGISSDDRNSNQVPVRVILAEHCELLKVAAELKTLHQKHHSLSDAAVRLVLDDRREAPPTGQLSNSDLFYRRISKIDDIFWGFLQAQEEVLSADASPRDAAMTILNVNEIFLSLLKLSKEGRLSMLSAATSRSILDDALLKETPGDSHVEYIPWYSSDGPRGLREVLIKQHGHTVETGLTRAEDGTVRGKLYTQIVDLSDEILTGFQPHLASLAAANHPRHHTLVEDYQRTRYALLQPLVRDEQFGQGIALAEKFCDFRVLVEICEKTQDQDRLDSYMTKFGSHGFSDFVFRWYLETGKRGKLLCHGSSEASREDLSKFLRDYNSLAWLHHINLGEFGQARDTLKDLALQETSYLSRKKTLLSLSKLCSIAASESSVVTEDIDPRILLEEDLVMYQEQIPEAVLTANAISPDTMRVFNPNELIHMYIGEDNVCGNEFDYKRALDLLSWLEAPEEIEELKRKIWVSAILRDSWQHLDTGNPVEALSETLFFRTLELAFNQGVDLGDILVGCDVLLSSDELESLRSDATFEFFVKAGYEKINQVLS